jgi:hypothetical protein
MKESSQVEQLEMMKVSVENDKLYTYLLIYQKSLKEQEENGTPTKQSLEGA